jgi:hypothetical protein
MLHLLPERNKEILFGAKKYQPSVHVCKNNFAFCYLFNLGLFSQYLEDSKIILSEKVPLDRGRKFSGDRKSAKCLRIILRLCQNQLFKERYLWSSVRILRNKAQFRIPPSVEKGAKL